MPEKSKEIKKIAREECANLHYSNCIFGYPCKILNDEDCNYFSKCVEPLIEMRAELKAKQEARKELKRQ